ncbi:MULTISPECIES: cytochrome c oxidase subunit II [unclassified Kitasatospora]|uniref:aa3-type cytochrome oxidase subunit II n=1 Tax=unclassified Kitasatospora TaxID=2633591 RepID=UPI00070EF473|nr:MULTISPECIES: cytochrome c oxidase subunit II [unclassified Kitasatospora]KQV16826.1 cytochrome C oxidase subunit II [Kitasatospora sp. Root107]KRB73727.1 cytochrome C oxidase subunit II [Kitasatospora sp. Root187]
MSPNGSDRSPRRTMRRKLPQALALGLVIATATGCSANDLPRLGLPSPVTAEGPMVLRMWQGSWIAALVVGALMWGLIIWSVIFHRRSRSKVEIPPQTRYNLPIEALYTAVPLVIVSVLFYFVARDEARLTSTSAKPDHVVNVVGFQWSWAFNYENTENPDPANTQAAYDVGTPAEPPTLYLPINETVQFRLTSRDVIHDFWTINFLMKQDVVPGVVNKFEVTPTALGTYRGKCAELCGVDHSRMLFNVKVVDRAEYDKHLAELRAKGQKGAVPSGITTMGSEK